MVRMCRTNSLLDTMFGEDEVEFEAMLNEEAMCKYPNTVAASKVLRNLILSSTNRIMSKIETNELLPRSSGVKAYLSNGIENTMVLFSVMRDR